VEKRRLFKEEKNTKDMEWFIGTVALYPFLKASSNKQHAIYKERRRIHEEKNGVVRIENKKDIYRDVDHDSAFYEICHSSSVNSNYYQTFIKILGNNPHLPSLIELLDTNGILQTMIAFYVKNFLKIFLPFQKKGIIYLPERLRMSDGGTVGLEWAVPVPKYWENPNITIKDLLKEKIVLLLPGILGEPYAEHVYFIAAHLAEAGYTAVVYTARGNGTLPLSSDSFFSGKVTNDFYEVVRYMKIHYQQPYSEKHRLFAIGYSLGGASLLNYLTKLKELSFLDAAIAVGPPYDIVKNSLYPTKLTTCGSAMIGLGLKSYFLRHYHAMRYYNPEVDKEIDYWQVMHSLTIKDYDDALYRSFYETTLRRNYEEEKKKGITVKNISPTHFHSAIAPTKKHQTVVDYYHDINASEHIKEIEIPTLVIAAKDDPICPHDNIPSGNDCPAFGDNVLVVRTLKKKFLDIFSYLSLLGETQFRWSLGLSGT
jgi:predicted alpha/beta-fold hydrolase